MTTHRQFYITPRVREIKGEMVPQALWVIREVTTSSERSPAWVELSSGSRSLATLIPDALALFDQANDTASLTITSRPVGPEIGHALPATPIGIDIAAADAITMALPIGGDYADLWTWVSRYRNTFSVEAKEIRFRRPALRWAVASVFNDRRVTSEHIDPSSAVLRSINGLVRPIELWLRPTWSAAELFPDAFPAKPDRQPVVPPKTVQAELQVIADKRERERRQARARDADARHEASTAQWLKDREAKQAREAKEARHEAEVQRRIREEMQSH
jgi:hypothetical protein